MALEKYTLLECVTISKVHAFLSVYTVFRVDTFEGYTLHLQSYRISGMLVGAGGSRISDKGARDGKDEAHQPAELSSRNW